MWLTIANGSYKIWTTFNLVDYIVLNADCSLGVSLSNVVRNIPRGSTACSREKMWNKLRGFCCATQWLWIWCWCHRCIMQPRAKPSVKKGLLIHVSRSALCQCVFPSPKLRHLICFHTMQLHQLTLNDPSTSCEHNSLLTSPIKANIN